MRANIGIDLDGVICDTYPEAFKDITAGSSLSASTKKYDISVSDKV